MRRVYLSILSLGLLSGCMEFGSASTDSNLAGDKRVYTLRAAEEVRLVESDIQSEFSLPSNGVSVSSVTSHASLFLPVYAYEEDLRHIDILFAQSPHMLSGDPSLCRPVMYLHNKDLGLRDGIPFISGRPSNSDTKEGFLLMYDMTCGLDLSGQLSVFVRNQGINSIEVHSPMLYAITHDNAYVQTLYDDMRLTRCTQKSGSFYPGYCLRATQQEGFDAGGSIGQVLMYESYPSLIDIHENLVDTAPYEHGAYVRVSHKGESLVAYPYKSANMTRTVYVATREDSDARVFFADNEELTYLGKVIVDDDYYDTSEERYKRVRLISELEDMPAAFHRLDHYESMLDYSLSAESFGSSYPLEVIIGNAAAAGEQSELYDNFVLRGDIMFTRLGRALKRHGYTLREDLMTKRYYEADDAMFPGALYEASLLYEP